METTPIPDNILPSLHTFQLPTEYQYLSHLPRQPPHVLILALHGYGMSPLTMLQLTKPILPESAAIASIQAPNQFYLTQTPSHSPTGYNWGTRAHGDASIALHHQMVLRVTEEMRNRCGVPVCRTILLGFSQPVGFNYRFAATFPNDIGGAIGICGGVPKNWETGPFGVVSVPILHIARDEDEFFPASVTADYPRQLRTRAADVEYHSLPGGHRFPSKARTLVVPWLERKFIASNGDAQP